MTPRDPGKIQYREAVEALKKMEPWRLAEIRHEFGIITRADPIQAAEKESK